MDTISAISMTVAARASARLPKGSPTRYPPPQPRRLQTPSYIDRLLSYGWGSALFLLAKQLQLPRWQFVGGGGEEFGDSVRTQRRHAFKIGLLVIPLICGMAVHPGFSKGGKSIGHAYVKSAARPSGTSAKQAPHSGNQGPAKTDIAHATVTHSSDRPNDIDTRITVQPRRLGKSVYPNTGPPAELPFARKPYHPRTLSALPRTPYPPIRNAIGLPISPRGTVGPHDGSHPNSLRASPSLVSPAVPNTATGRLVRAAVPRSTPNFVTLGAGRGAISGTGLAPRHQGPSQIGRPKAVAGINGTTIKPVR
jgi:hypothetical protein